LAQAFEPMGTPYNGQPDRIPTMFRGLTMHYSCSFGDWPHLLPE
jgi:hypothetical protein